MPHTHTRRHEFLQTVDLISFNVGLVAVHSLQSSWSGVTTTCFVFGRLMGHPNSEDSVSHPRNHDSSRECITFLKD